MRIYANFQCVNPRRVDKVFFKEISSKLLWQAVVVGCDEKYTYLMLCCAFTCNLPIYLQILSINYIKENKSIKPLQISFLQKDIG